MTLLAPIALNVVGIAAAVLGGLMIVAYILKMRRRRFEVPFSTLWNRVLKERESTALWKHLRRILSLLFLLAILGALLFAATEPRLGEPDRDARSLVVILDTSASMQTTDAGESQDQPRIEVAKKRVDDLLATLGGGDMAMLMRMDGQSTPLTPFVDDMPGLRRRLDEIRATDTPADLRRALAAASDALRERPNPMIVIVGDGAYPEAVLNSVTFEPPRPAQAAPTKPTDSATTDRFADKRLDVIDMSGIDVSYIPVGRDTANVGIIAFNVRRYIANKMSYEVFIEVQNFGTTPAKRRLVLYSGKAGENPIEVRQIELKPGQRVREIYPDLGGGDGTRLVASLELTEETAAIPGMNGDAFPLDDTAYALLPNRRKQNVLLVTTDNLYLEGAMLIYENIDIIKMTPEEYDAQVTAPNFPEYDATVFDGHTPAVMPPGAGHALYFAPSGEHNPFELGRELRAPKVDRTNEDHPVMRWLVMSDVNFESSATFRVRAEEREVALASSIRSPLIVAKREGARKLVGVGFPLNGTDMVLRVAFPLFLVNTLDWFAGDDSDLITTYATGRRVTVPMDGTFAATRVDVVPPGRLPHQAPIRDSNAIFYADTVGVHELVAYSDEQELARIELATNLANADESDIAPSGELNMGGRTLAEPTGFTLSHRQGLWSYLALLALLLLGIEWYTYNRRMTV